MAAKPGRLNYAQQECRLSSFHLRCLRRILGISNKNRVPNNDHLEMANTPSVFMLLPRDAVYARSAMSNAWRMGAFHRMSFKGNFLQASVYKDVCKIKRDMTSTEINPDLWEAAAYDPAANGVVSFGHMLRELRCVTMCH